MQSQPLLNLSFLWTPLWLDFHLCFHIQNILCLFFFFRFLCRLSSLCRDLCQLCALYTVGPHTIYGHVHYRVKYDKQLWRQSFSIDCFNKLPYLLFIYQRRAAPITQLHETKQKAVVINSPTLSVKRCSLEDSMRTARLCHVSAADISTITLLFVRSELLTFLCISPILQQRGSEYSH